MCMIRLRELEGRKHSRVEPISLSYPDFHLKGVFLNKKVQQSALMVEVYLAGHLSLTQHASLTLFGGLAGWLIASL